MATTNETLPLFTHTIQFRAEYDDLPMFKFFVVAIAIVSAYLILSLPLSILHIVRGSDPKSRIILIFFNAAMLGPLTTAGASAAAAIVYLAHKGNTKTNWFAICQQFNSLLRANLGFSDRILCWNCIRLCGVALSRR